jgi:hypothetical protein
MVNNLAAGVYDIDISLIGSSAVTTEALLLDVIKYPVVTSIEPALLSVPADNLVKINGVFSGLQHLKCMFSTSFGDDVLETPVSVDKQQIICPFVASKYLITSSISYLNVGLSVAVNQASIMLSTLPLIESPTLTSFTPKTIAAGDHLTNIQIFGKFNRFTPFMKCRVGTSIFNITQSSDHSVICPAAVQRIGSYSLSVSIDGLNFVSAPSSISVIDPPKTLYVREPLRCPTSGSFYGYKVFGDGFPPFENLIECRIGHIVSSPVAISNEDVTCLCPSLDNILGPDVSFDNSTISVKASLSIHGQIDPLISADVHFFHAPSFRLQNSQLLVGTSTPVLIHVDQFDLFD